MRQEVLPGPLRVSWIVPTDHVQPSEGAAEVREVEAAIGVVVREMAGLRAVGPHMDGREGLVRQSVDVSTRPRLGPG